MSYFSPDAILTDAQKAPCEFGLAVPQLTPLNNGSAIDKGTKLELPLWIAEMLAVSKPADTALATLDMPAPLGHRVLNALRADPKSVDVRAQAQWFYGLGERMLELFEDEEVAEVLNDVSCVLSQYRCANTDRQCRHSSKDHWRLQTRRRIPVMYSKAVITSS